MSTCQSKSWTHLISDSMWSMLPLSPMSRCFFYKSCKHDSIQAALYTTLNHTSTGAAAALRGGGFSPHWSISPPELRLWITACCVFNHPNHKASKNTYVAGSPAIFKLQNSASVPWQHCQLRDCCAFSLKICQRILRGNMIKIQAHTCVQAAAYLQAHGGWDQQSLGHPPTRRAKVPAAPAADFAARRLARRPSSIGWSCTGWGPPPSPGTALARKWVPATQTSSIWSLSDQPATQEREGGKGSIGVQSWCFKIHSAPSREQAEQAFWSSPPSYQLCNMVLLTAQTAREQTFWDDPKPNCPKAQNISLFYS